MQATIVTMDALFVFITKAGAVVDGQKYVYNDDYRVCHENNVITIDYSSQKVWKTGDNLLKQNVPTFIFIRMSMRETFKYAGQVRFRQVLHERSKDAPLCMRFTLNIVPNTMYTSGKEFAPLSCMDAGRYKRGVYKTLGAIPTKGNGITTGIVPVRWDRASYV